MNKLRDLMEHAAKRPRTSRFLTLCALDPALPLEKKKKKKKKKRKKQKKKEKKRRKERSKQTKKKSHHHSNKSVHYYCVSFIWGMLAHPSGAKLALWDQLGPWQRDQLAPKQIYLVLEMTVTSVTGKSKNVTPLHL